MTYANEIAKIDDLIKEKGLNVTFSRADANAYDEATDTYTPGTPTTDTADMVVVPLRKTDDDNLREDLIKGKVRLGLISAASTTREPIEGDTTTLKGVGFTIYGKTTVDPNQAEPMLYKVILRQR